MYPNPFSYPNRQKSLKSYDAGEFLLKNRYYDQAVHASYNAVIQLFLHIIHELKGINESELSQEVKLRRAKLGSHEVYCMLVLRQIERKSIRSYRAIKRNLNILKTLRVKADYNTSVCQEKESKRALSLATDIWNELKCFYQIGGMLM